MREYNLSKNNKKTNFLQRYRTSLWKKSNVTIMPGDESSGILFKRVDLNNNNLINANYKNVSSTTLSTTLQNKYGIKVSTVEHLLAALYIAGIDSAIIEIDNEEGSNYGWIR